MILPFSTQLNGKPTEFVSKIWEGLIPEYSKYTKGVMIFEPPIEYHECIDKDLICLYKQKPKVHTIREDLKDRWRPGTKIDFFINCRQKNMFRFAPVLPVVGVQKIEIVYYTDKEVLRNNLPPKINVAIDDRVLNSIELIQLAHNDGFDTLEDFFDYFNNDYTGKLIHWTNLRY